MPLPTRGEVLVVAGLALWLLAIPTLWSTDLVWGTIVMLAWVLTPSGIAAGYFRPDRRVTWPWIAAACVPGVAIVVAIVYLARGRPVVDDADRLDAGA
ncbi:hypothetical protein [Halorubrum trueperi]|uniref:Uncharacterized protein n=1 Tax=Halorubrum trueperi TaxID=2004704 RepID=A0ABD5UI95_9EURY